MTKIERIVKRAFTMSGKGYIYGYEIEPLSKENPKYADCSELVEWACFKEGLRPFMPDGAVWQYRHCYQHDTEMDIEEAMYTRGALLFRFSTDPLETRPRSAHVGFSLGDGKHVFEARGRKYGIGTWAHEVGDWTHAALIPGADYKKGPIHQPQ